MRGGEGEGTCGGERASTPSAPRNTAACYQVYKSIDFLLDGSIGQVGADLSIKHNIRYQKQPMDLKAMKQLDLIDCFTC